MSRPFAYPVGAPSTAELGVSADRTERLSIWGFRSEAKVDLAGPTSCLDGPLAPATRHLLDIFIPSVDQTWELGGSLVMRDEDAIITLPNVRFKTFGWRVGTLWEQGHMVEDEFVAMRDARDDPPDLSALCVRLEALPDQDKNVATIETPGRLSRSG